MDELDTIPENFTDNSFLTLLMAQEEALRLGQKFVSTELILLGLIRWKTGVAAKVLKEMGVNLRNTSKKVEKIIGRGSSFVAKEISLADDAKRVLKLSEQEACQLGHKDVTNRHLLLGLILEECGATRVLENLGLDLSEVRKRTVAWLGEDELAPLETRAKIAIAIAEREALRLGQKSVSTELILLGLIGWKTGIADWEIGVAAKVLKEMGVNLKDTRKEVEKFIGQDPSFVARKISLADKAKRVLEKFIGRGSSFVAEEIFLADEAKRVLELSQQEARQLGYKYVSAEHLLLGLISEECGATRVLENLKVDLSKLRTQVIRAISSEDFFEEL